MDFSSRSLKRCNLWKQSKKQNHLELKITELFRSEKTSGIIESSLWLITTLTTRPWQWVPNPDISQTQNDPTWQTWSSSCCLSPIFHRTWCKSRCWRWFWRSPGHAWAEPWLRCLSSHPKLCSGLHSPLQISQWEKTECGGEFLL